MAWTDDVPGCTWPLCRTWSRPRGCLRESPGGPWWALSAERNADEVTGLFATPNRGVDSCANNSQSCSRGHLQGWSEAHSASAMLPGSQLDPKLTFDKCHALHPLSFSPSPTHTRAALARYPTTPAGALCATVANRPQNSRESKFVPRGRSPGCIASWSHPEHPTALRWQWQCSFPPQTDRSLVGASPWLIRGHLTTNPVEAHHQPHLQDRSRW